MTQADISKIKKHLKWKPNINISGGTKLMLNKIDFWKKGKLWTKSTIKVDNSSSNLDIKLGNEIDIGWNSDDARALDPK